MTVGIMQNIILKDEKLNSETEEILETMLNSHNDAF